MRVRVRVGIRVKISTPTPTPSLILTLTKWTSDGVLLGWATELPTYNLTHAVVKGAGHLTALDQPLKP